ncbi:MAG TPA: STAS domain-containing protein [Casimicrobiaceae bacterium]
MAIRIETGIEGYCKAIVDGAMTIYEAAADKPLLLSALAAAKETEIDLSSVDEMDTAGLQLLILVKRESMKAGKVLHLSGHSPAALDVFERYNLGSYFGHPAVASSRDQKKGREAKSRKNPVTKSRQRSAAKSGRKTSRR